MLHIVSCTNRTNARTLQVAHWYLEMAQRQGFPATVVDLAQLPPAFLDPCLAQPNPAPEQEVEHWQQQAHDANAFLFVIPEYNGSFPGIFKLYIDGMAFPETFQGKVAALTGLSAGTQGSALAMSHAADILHFCGVYVAPTRLRIPNIFSSFKDSRFAMPPKLETLAQRQLDEIAHLQRVGVV